jgi:PleD family two-component response regulator
MISSSRILLVDDDAQVTTALELILAAGQFEEITVVANAEDAFDVLGLTNDDAEVPPAVDVIVLDVMMPGIDGIEACARIRKTRRYRDIPIIMCSGLDQTTSLNQAFIAGAHDYLTKPIRKIELLARVRSAMRFKRELDRRRAREAEIRRGQQVEGPRELSYMDTNTNLPNQRGFEVAMRQAVAAGQPYGLLGLQIADIEALRSEAGPEAVQDLSATVARVIATVAAPLDWKLYIFNEGLFIVLAPRGTADQLAMLGKRAAEAVDAMRIIHGHSLEHDFVRLSFAATRGRGTELLTLPADLFRMLESSEKTDVILHTDQTRAA